MKTITMQESGQIFEIFTSQKEFTAMIKMLDWSINGQWNDEDASLTLIYRNGTTVNYQYGDDKKPLRLTQIIAGEYSNSATNMIYNCAIVKNEYYDDYEAILP